jgi:hypothetical protein
MDRADEYRDIIERILEAHPRIPFGHGQIESKFIRTYASVTLPVLFLRLVVAL